jgi:hypothetical protein
MTTLWPGMSFPSCSATSIIRFAILSLTEPPAEVYSSFPTDTDLGLREDPNMREMHGLTEIASKTLLFRYPIEANERCISDSIEDRVQNESRIRHFEVVVD